MTIKEQNLRIAKGCGWKWVLSDPREGMPKYPHWVPPTNWHSTSVFAQECFGERPYPPDYVNDLNAIREAEVSKWHDEEFIEIYEEELKKTYIKHVGYTGAAYWWMSSAKIRAEAFLRALGGFDNNL